MIPIVYASSEEFAPIMCVSIASLLKNRKPETRYKVYIMSAERFSEETMKMLSRVFESDPDTVVEWVEMHDRFKRTRVNAAGVGKESNYRLLIAELLQEEKCVYLDADTLICGDLSEFFSTNIDDYFIAGLHPEYFLWKTTENYTHAHYDRFEKMIRKHTGMLRYDQYVGAGVLLMNLKKLREDGMVARFLAEVPLYSGPQDQDILNACCYGRILTFSSAYCVDLHETEKVEWYVKYKPELYPMVSRAMEHPLIIHFSDRYKPWLYIGIRYETLWWEYAFSSGAAGVLWNTFAERYIRDTDYEVELARVTHSISYRVGRALTLIPRVLLKK